jgi:hypothetical protein
MSKLTLAIVAMFLAGCASMGEWRALNIDGSSDAAFRESLTRLHYELSYLRSQMFELALVDIANTRVQTAGAVDDDGTTYSEEDFRHDLDGLTYESVIALADQSGPPIKNLYYSRGWGDTRREVDRLLSAGDYALGPTPPAFQPMDTSNGFSGFDWPNQ